MHRRGRPRSPLACRWLDAAGRLAAAALLVACAGEPLAEQSAGESGSRSETIAWREADLEEAFQAAEREGKPLFLYWGAEWCPPCHYLKNKIFRRPEFVAKMRDFIPVYLDGDTERAQIVGEKLAVKGYPTVILFDPLGNEVMRMPSTVPMEQYEEVLDAAVAGMKPVKAVLQGVLESGPAKATPAELNLLAFYSWGQDSTVQLSSEERVTVSRRLYEETPRHLRVQRSRFLGLYLQALGAREREVEADDFSLAAEERVALQEHVLEVLADPELCAANLSWIDYSANAIIGLLQPTESPAREQLLVAWQKAAEAMETDPALSVDDRLAATLLRVKLARLGRTTEDDEPPDLPAELLAHVRQRVAWAAEAVTDEGELQTVVNTLANLLEQSGLNSEAETLLLSKMDQTAAPYYFMTWIGDLKKDAGDRQTAIAWYRRAYDSARGRYSRFRWGSSYLRRLMELVPEASAQIEADSLEVLGELLTHDDAFAGGNYSRLSGLEEAYRSWSQDGDYSEELARIRDYVRASCGRYPGDAEDSQRRRCESFLETEVTAGDSVL